MKQSCGCDADAVPMQLCPIGEALYNTANAAFLDALVGDGSPDVANDAVNDWLTHIYREEEDVKMPPGIFFSKMQHDATTYEPMTMLPPASNDTSQEVPVDTRSFEEKIFDEIRDMGIRT